MIKSFFNALLDAVYPPRCLICDEVVACDTFFCKECNGKLKLQLEKRCGGCGMSAEKCCCNRYIYHFEGVISPYFNEDDAQKCVYNFKFNKNKRASELLGEKMAKAAKLYYKDVDFDLITSVCASKKNTDYDHCKILAKKVSESMGVNYLATLERSDKKRQVQHGLGLDKRFDNVHNAYKASCSLKGKIILLVDDIKTSGATIDECARQLKFAGAESVYCVTALVGDLKNQD